MQSTGDCAILLKAVQPFQERRKRDESSRYFPGNVERSGLSRRPQPFAGSLCRLGFGDVCNTSSLHACLHNGTHMDAPRHFVPDGTDAAHVPLDACIGECSVVNFDGLLLGAQAEALLPGLRSRVLFKGKMELSPSAAFVLADSGLRLLGVEGQSVAPAECTVAVHRQLLSSGMVLLEGLDLSGVEEGIYFLMAAPLKIDGADGSPVRAHLVGTANLISGSVGRCPSAGI